MENLGEILDAAVELGPAEGLARFAGGLERKECLRSKKPEGVAQELRGALLLYNLVRNEMLKVAAERGLVPRCATSGNSRLGGPGLATSRGTVGSGPRKRSANLPEPLK